MRSGDVCSVCGSELLQKSRLALFATGLFLLAAAAAGPFFNPLLWLFTAPAAIVALYLIVWSALGKGLWCRNCKKFPADREDA